jgi:xanthine dehydrogenase accessory factor
LSDMLPVGMHANSWLTKALASLDDGQDIVLVTVTATKGSSPRDHGSHMLVTKAGIWQTIGGGALEFDVMARARKMLASDDDNWQRQHMTVILGPDMGQCCGGQMSLLLEKFTAKQAGALAALAQEGCQGQMLAHPLGSGVPLRLQSALSSFDEAVFMTPVMPRQMPLFIFGAGHVSRALIPRLDGLEFDIFLVDIEADRFANNLGDNVQKLLAKAPEKIALRAPQGAVHLVMTHSHSLDEAICLQLLMRGDFAYLGLIGSKSKRARFAKRLAAAGVPSAMLDQLICPIGISEINGKSPAHVALSIAADLAIGQRLRDDAKLRANEA